MIGSSLLAGHVHLRMLFTQECYEVVFANVVCYKQIKSYCKIKLFTYIVKLDIN